MKFTDTVNLPGRRPGGNGPANHAEVRRAIELNIDLRALALGQARRRRQGNHDVSPRLVGVSGGADRRGDPARSTVREAHADAGPSSPRSRPTPPSMACNGGASSRTPG